MRAHVPMASCPDILDSRFALLVLLRPVRVDPTNAISPFHPLSDPPSTRRLFIGVTEMTELERTDMMSLSLSRGHGRVTVLNQCRLHKTKKHTVGPGPLPGPGRARGQLETAPSQHEARTRTRTPAPWGLRVQGTWTRKALGPAPSREKSTSNQSACVWTRTSTRKTNSLLTITISLLLNHS